MCYSRQQRQATSLPGYELAVDDDIISKFSTSPHALIPPAASVHVMFVMLCVVYVCDGFIMMH